MALEREAELAALRKLDPALALIQQKVYSLSDASSVVGELLGAYAELHPAAKSLVQVWKDTSAQIDTLEQALNGLLNIEVSTPITRLRDAITKRDGLSGVISANEGSIYSLRSNQVSSEGVAWLRGLEASLWASYRASNGDPKIAAELTKVTLDRIRLDAKVTQAAQASGDTAAAAAAKTQKELWATQATALKEQISGYDRLIEMAKSLRDYVVELKKGDLSNLSYADRLATSRGAFESAVAGARAGDGNAAGKVQGLAQDYLSQSQKFYGGATTPYSDIFNSVTGTLESLAGSNFLPTKDAVQQQLDTLQALIDGQAAAQQAAADTTQAEITALEGLNSTFAVDVSALSSAVDAQTLAARDALAELKLQKAVLEAQITQNAEAYKRMVADLDVMTLDIGVIRKLTEVASAAP